MKKLFVALLALAMVFAFAACESEVPFEANVSSTEELIEVIAGLTETSDETIYLANGDYQAQIIVPENATLTIVGESEDGVVISMPSSGAVKYSETDSPADITFVNNHVNGIGTVMAKSGSSLDISNVTLKSNGEVGSYGNYDYATVLAVDADLTLDHVTLSGTYTEAQNGVQTGWEINVLGSEANEIVITNCSISNFNKNGINQRDVNDSLTVKNTKISGVGDNTVTAQNGIVAAAHETTIEGNNLSDLITNKPGDGTSQACGIIYNSDVFTEVDYAETLENKNTFTNVQLKVGSSALGAYTAQ